jgi:DNA-binding response OmpR family regulator
MKVLIVDDEPNIVMSLDFLMRKAKYEVFIARNGQEALHIAQAQLPELVILDIMMPDIDGYEVCRQLRSNADMQHAKIVFLSAKSKESDLQQGYAAGANLYLTKPFSTKDLMKKVQELFV